MQKVDAQSTTGETSATMRPITIHIYGGPEYPHYLEQFVGWIKEGKLYMKIARTYPLAEASRAHDAFEQRQVSGRLLLLP
jgi:NADPH2:quinone reductase